MDTVILRKLGLEEKEISVYLTLLRVGNTTASVVSKETNIDRATCYRYLDSLIHKGILSYSIQNNVKYYKAASPRKLLHDLKEKQDEYKKLLPLLLELENMPTEETKAEVYNGKEGIKTVLREILRGKKNHLVMGDDGHIQEVFPIFFEQFVRDCERSKIQEKVLCSQSVKDKVSKFDYKYSQTRCLPNDNLIPTTTVITDEKVILFNWKLPYNAVVISNKDMAQAYKNYFDILWKTAR